MDRLEAMEVLLEVVAQGNLSAAGRRLGVPLTTVSRKIADLERHLGARLLQRSNRQATLTEAGLAYVEASRRILQQVAEAEAAASGAFAAVRGDLVITAPVVFGRLHVLPVVGAFLQEYPEIDIRLTLADRLLHLQEDHVDLALRIGALPDSSLKALRLGQVRRVVCASPAYLDRRGRPRGLEDLARHDCISFTGLGQPERWSFALNEGERAVRLRCRLAVNTAEAALDAAEAGLGLTRVLSYQVAPRGDRLETVLQAFEPAALPVSLLYDGQGAQPVKLRAFVDFAAPLLRARLAGG